MGLPEGVGESRNHAALGAVRVENVTAYGPVGTPRCRVLGLSDFGVVGFKVLGSKSSGVGL